MLLTVVLSLVMMASLFLMLYAAVNVVVILHVSESRHFGWSIVPIFGGFRCFFELF